MGRRRSSTREPHPQENRHESDFSRRSSIASSRSSDWTVSDSDAPEHSGDTSSQGSKRVPGASCSPEACDSLTDGHLGENCQGEHEMQRLRSKERALPKNSLLHEACAHAHALAVQPLHSALHVHSDDPSHQDHHAHLNLHAHFSSVVLTKEVAPDEPDETEVPYEAVPHVSHVATRDSLFNVLNGPDVDAAGVQELTNQSNDLRRYLQQLNDLCRRAIGIPFHKVPAEVVDNIRMATEGSSRALMSLEGSLGKTPSVHARLLNVEVGDLLSQLYEAVLGDTNVDVKKLLRLSMTGLSLLSGTKGIAKRSQGSKDSRAASHESNLSGWERHSDRHSLSQDSGDRDSATEGLVSRRGSFKSNCSQRSTDPFRPLSAGSLSSCAAGSKDGLIDGDEDGYESAAAVGRPRRASLDAGEWLGVKAADSASSRQGKGQSKGDPAQRRVVTKARTVHEDPREKMLREMRSRQRPNHTTLEAVCLGRLMQPVWCLDSPQIHRQHVALSEPSSPTSLRCRREMMRASNSHPSGAVTSRLDRPLPTKYHRRPHRLMGM